MVNFVPILGFISLIGSITYYWSIKYALIHNRIVKTPVYAEIGSEIIEILETNVLAFSVKININKKI
jgi:hypothetical protein